MKRILDSVHGEILIPRKYFEGIIDTPEFQRLRPIDQSAIRSVFPCARHDRFVHSIGVFNIGSKIAYHLRPLLSGKTDSTVLQTVIESYLMACLLHDIGHAPFSHTFEKYFGDKKILSERLNKELVDYGQGGIITENNYKYPNYHEYTSAIISVDRFAQIIKELDGNPELVARMITGIKYEDKGRSLENCFIELLHGEIIDADRLDYACRDVWASGYATANFDLTRLINAIELDDEPGEWIIIYKSSVINEIESLLRIRDFQNKNVIGHHTVVYDQNLLQEAVRESALKKMKNSHEQKDLEDKAVSKENHDNKSNSNHNYDTIDEADEAVERICTLTNLSGDGEYSYLSDSDLISLIKNDKENESARHWFARQYRHIPLWKTNIEFNLYFPFFKEHSLNCIDFEEILKSTMQSFKINDFRIYPLSIKGDVDLSDMIIRIGEATAKISEVIPRKTIAPKKSFYFAYIPKELEAERMTIIKALKPQLKAAVSSYEEGLTRD